MDDSPLPVPSEETGRDPAEDTPRPAVQINIQSWATPIVGLVMLVAGLALGYFGRPLLASSSRLAAATTPTIAAAPASEDTTPGPTVADQAQLMTYLVSQTRHFKGDPNAPITIIEFSDYQ